MVYLLNFAVKNNFGDCVPRHTQTKEINSWILCLVFCSRHSGHHCTVMIHCMGNQRFFTFAHLTFSFFSLLTLRKDVPGLAFVTVEAKLEGHLLSTMCCSSVKMMLNIFFSSSS